MTLGKVLVVEDEDSIAEDIMELLESFDCEIVGRASSVEGVLDLVEAEEPDLVLMDIKLDGEGDGVDAAMKIREESRVPIVFLTGYSDIDLLERAKKTEPHGYLVKPFKDIDLKTTVEMALYTSLKRHLGASSNGDTRESQDEPYRAVFEAAEKMGKGATKSFSKISAPLTQLGTEIFERLRSMDEFKEVEEDDLKGLASSSIRKKHTAGDIITLEGEVQNAGFIVDEGRAVFLKSSAKGRDLIVEFLVSGDSLGLLAALENEGYPYSTRIQTESTLIWVPRHTLLELFGAYPVLGERFLTKVLTRLKKSHDFSRLLAHEKVEVRVASALETLYPHFTSHEDNETVIRMTRQELAELTGTTEETCIRVTRAMEKAGILNLSENKAIRIVNRSALQEVANTTPDEDVYSASR